MENQSSNQIEMEAEDFPDEFQCCVCLDIMYKPVVLACGHISCFWCVFSAMDMHKESHCPVCRNTYNHFPRVCKLIHFLLLKLYTSAYKKRGKLVAEEEQQHNASSPMFEYELDTLFNEVSDAQKPSPEESKSSYMGEKTLLGEDSISTVQTTSNSDITNGTCQKVLATDLQCAACKKLLCRPIVLNCGHVCCGTCVDNQDGIYRCPECQSANPKGLPKVCLVLEHFLEESFPKEYLARKESLASFQIGSSSASLPKKQKEESQDSDSSAAIYSSWISGNFHPAVGCDYCGMAPISGKRYRCKDCKESMGFDLCEGCYNSSSDLPGRFNQQHTREHQLVLVGPPHLEQVSLNVEGADDLSVDIMNNGGPFVMGGLEFVYYEDDEIENALQEIPTAGDDAVEPGDD